MSAVTEVAALLKPIDGVDGVYPTKLPDNVSTDTANTVILVTETLADSPAVFGSDKTTTFKRTVAINIFYGLSKSDQSDDIEGAIFSALENAGWYQTYTAGHVLDPDTNQLSRAMQFTNQKER